jgi:hypothetical protein
MTPAGGSDTDSSSLPLVAVVSVVPMLCEALSHALDGIAEVRGFPAGRGDTAGLLRSLRPQAVIVDSQEEADEAADFAREADAPLVFVSYPDESLRVLKEDGWHRPEETRPSPEAIRNVVVGGLFGRVSKGAAAS